MGLLRPQRHWGYISVITPTLLGIAHIGVRDHPLSIIFLLQTNIKKISINVKNDSAHHLKTLFGKDDIMNPLNINALNPKPPTSTEIITLIILGVVAIALFQYVVYTKVKERGYRISCREILRLEMTILKSAIIDTSRMVLLVLVMFLPLLAITWSTELSVIFVFDLILTKVRSFPLLGFEIAYLFLFLYAIMLFIYYFFTKYGSIYKLPFLSLVRKDIRQYFSKHIDILMILLVGSVTYATAILVLLTDLVNAPSPLSKEIIGIVTVVLLIEVLRNKKYHNAFKLVEKIMKVQD